MALRARALPSLAGRPPPCREARARGPWPRRRPGGHPACGTAPPRSGRRPGETSRVTCAGDVAHLVDEVVAAGQSRHLGEVSDDDHLRVLPPVRAACCATATAVRPPMPASISSKTRVSLPPAPARAHLMPSSTRDSSPPDAVRARLRGSWPGLATQQELHLVAPALPQTLPARARLRMSTVRAADGMPRSANWRGDGLLREAGRPACALLGAADAARSSARAAVRGARLLQPREVVLGELRGSPAAPSPRADESPLPRCVPPYLRPGRCRAADAR